MTVDQFVETTKASLGEVGFRDRFLSGGWFLMILWLLAIFTPGFGTIIIVVSDFSGWVNVTLIILTIISAFAFFSWTVVYNRAGSPLAKRSFVQRLIRFMDNVFSDDLEIAVMGRAVEIDMMDGHRVMIKYRRDVWAGLPMMVMGGPTSIKTRPTGTAGPRDFCVAVTGETTIPCRGKYTFDFSGRGGDQFGKGVRLIDRLRRELPCEAAECSQIMDRLAAVVKFFPVKGEVSFKGQKFKLKIYDPLASDSFCDTEPEISLSRKVQDVWKQKGWEIADIPFAGAGELLEIIVGSRDPASLKDSPTWQPAR